MRRPTLVAFSLMALLVAAATTPSLLVTESTPPSGEQRLAKGDGQVERLRRVRRRSRLRTQTGQPSPSVETDGATLEADGTTPCFATLLIRDARGRPVAGVPAAGWGGTTPFPTSDPDGRIVLPLPGPDVPSLSLQNLSGDQVSPKAGETTEIELSQVIPLEVHLVDAERGTPIDGQVEVASGDGAFVLMKRVGAFYELDPAPVEAARDAELRFRATLPAGYAERTISAKRSALVSRYAKRVLVTLPVRPEARVLVRVVDEEGDPVAGARVPCVSLATQRQEPIDDVTDARGEVHLRGLSFVRGFVLRVQVAAPDGRTNVGSAYLSDNSAEALVEVVLRQEPESLSWYRGPAGEVSGCPGVCNHRREGGALALWIVRRGGKPAAHAGVRVSHHSGRFDWERTDADGRMRCTDLPAGRFTVDLVEPGLVYTQWTFEVGAGETVEEVVQEDAGHTLVVTAKSEHGTPLPYVRLRLSPRGSRNFTCLGDDDVQRLDVHTNAWGRVRIPHLPGPDAVVKAEYAALRTWDDVPVTEPFNLTIRDPTED